VALAQQLGGAGGGLDDQLSRQLRIEAVLGAGVQPITAVAASNCASGNSTTWPSSSSKARVRVDSAPATQRTPRPTSTATLGMTRIVSALGKAAPIASNGVAPSKETTVFAPASSPATSSSFTGFTAKTTRSARSASSAFEATASPPSSSASAFARPDPESVKSIEST